MYCLAICLFAQAAFTAGLSLRATNTSVRPIHELTIAQVKANAISSSVKSWELGTLAEALLEVSWPKMSVFTNSSYPPKPINTTLYPSAYPSDVVQIAKNVLGARVSGLLPLVADDAVGDPASIGTAMLLANFTEIHKVAYADAASDQLEYLMKYAKRSPSGAISHRADQVQLWADFVYMAPPFMANYGLWKGGKVEQDLMQQAYDQCRLYRDALLDPEAGLWRHITLGSWNDTNHWATGNAWAAAGMMRVYESIKKSNNATSMKVQQTDLKNWINEILTSSFQYQRSTGAITNVVDDPSAFSDSSATALLSATAFRYATLFGDKTLIPEATKALNFVKHNIDENGWLQRTVDPYSFYTEQSPGAVSPEGQSFVLLLHSAVRDYLASTDKKANPSIFVANFLKD